MVVFATLAGFGAGSLGFGEAKLRSQNMKFALLSVPAGMGGLAEAIVRSGKGGEGAGKSIHSNSGKE